MDWKRRDVSNDLFHGRHVLVPFLIKENGAGAIKQRILQFIDIS
jgi:hypothetical protein